MRVYLIKRLLLVPVTLIGITFITFAVMKLAPGDPVKILKAQAAGGTMAAQQASLEAIEEWKKERHLDKHWTLQYLYWVGDMVRLDLGKAFTPPRQKVIDLILERLPVTIGLSLISFFLIYLVAIPVGIVGAARQFSWTDRVLTIAVFLLYSLPNFWIGTLMIAFLTGPQSLGFPTSGYHPGTLSDLGLWDWIRTQVKYKTLPIACLTYAGFAFLSRQMRSGLLEQIRQDYVRTARAKGLAERVVVLRHATRNALIPVVTLFGTILPAMIGGSIIIETLFSIPGMGQLFFSAINERDYPIIMGIETITALLTMAGILISDFLYVAVNPTISYE